MSGDKNCSKLVWSAYKNAGNLDIDSNKETWIAYFAPSSTDVIYTEGNASLVEFNKNGDVKYYNTDPYPFSALLNFNNELIFQTKNGTAKFNGDIYKEDNTLNEDTVGYTMAGTLKDSLYYFLCNGSFKKDYYSSKIILGDKENNTVHEINGFINSYGNDESNNLAFDYEVESNFKMIVSDTYIYAFVIRDRNNKYYLYSYNLDGKLLDSIKLNSLKLKNNLYPHNFIKVRT